MERMAYTTIVYTVKDVARLLGVHVTTVYRAVEAGTLPHKRLATTHGKGRILIPSRALENWLEHPDKPRRVEFNEKLARITADKRR